MNLFTTIVVMVVIISLGLVTGDGNADWAYRNGSFLSPSQWQNAYKSCASYRQSPININKERVKYWSALRPPKVVRIKEPLKVAMKRSELTVSLTFNESWNITFGGSDCYRPISIHWHWGSVDSQGSEHTLFGTSYPIEGHLVTYNCRLYTSSEVAMTSPSGLHVFGILYQIGQTNPTINSLMTPLSTLKTGNSTELPEISPLEFFPKDLSRYFRYEGSLTTPPCTENVIWTLFREVQTIDLIQLTAFRSLKYGKPEQGNMVDNYRSVVTVTSAPDYVHRTIYASFNGARHRSFVATLIAVSTILIQAQTMVL